MRKIKIYSTAGMSGLIDTDARTLSVLKPLLVDLNIPYAGMSIIVGETRNELTLDDALLPEGDFKVYLMPKEVDSGSSPMELIDGMNKKLDEVQKAVDVILKQVSTLCDSMAEPLRKACAEPYLTQSIAKEPLSPEDQEAFDDLNAIAAARIAKKQSPANYDFDVDFNDDEDEDDNN